MPKFRIRHRFLWLIACSLALLAVFQVFWLRKVWQEQRESLRQESNYLFQQTITALQDSLVMRNMIVSGNESDTFRVRLHQEMPITNPGEWMIKRNVKTRVDFPDSDRLLMFDSTSVDQVQVFITATDSAGLPGMPELDGILSKVPDHAPPQRMFSFRLNRDTMSMDTLRLAYRRSLDQAGIDVGFSVEVSSGLYKTEKDDLRTDPAFSGLLTRRFYAAELTHATGYLLRKMLPYFFFSLLLFGMTAAAFWVIYRNLRQQQRLAALKNEFIGNITHELKTPITTVGVALEALNDFEVLNDPEKAREYLSISQLELERLTLLVDKVLRLSTFETQPPRLKMEPVELPDLVQQVLDAMKLQAESVGAEIRFDREPGANFTIQGDRLHLISVVFNLVDNALKYRGKNAPLIKVFLQNAAPGRIRLVVEDNGTGIEEAYRLKVFEKFFRVPAGNTHNVKGHGLGLNYVANVVQQHGGSIRVESPTGPDGSGSRFIVELPVAGRT
ncbi:MAG: HAMP domain-containing histidine kinase [Saprospiraceae bacterium]|nr:HAMP domain-containing histidine kinase [Saprospiraceae bacterium]